MRSSQLFQVLQGIRKIIRFGMRECLLGFQLVWHIIYWGILVKENFLLCLLLFGRSRFSALFTAWRVLGNSIASKANLVRRVVEVGSTFSYMWGEEGETTRHPFFECRIVWLVWNQCYEWLGVTLVDHNDSISYFLHFKLCNVPTFLNVVWESVWIAVIGEIWRHRNKHFFKRGMVDHFKIFFLIQLKVWS